MVKAFPDQAQNPFGKDHAFYLHIEVEAFDEVTNDAEKRLHNFFERIGDLIEVSV